jgi:hypothetical protein
MATNLRLDRRLLDGLAGDPAAAVEGSLAGTKFRLSIALAAYRDGVATHYAGLCRPAANGPETIPFSQFGLICEFEHAIEIEMHDRDKVLDDHVRALVERFGPVIVTNAYLDAESRKEGHRNIFPHLRFHSDRGPGHPNQYSLFTRDPFDAEQARPRESSTLFIANAVALLQTLKEHGPEQAGNGSYDIFGRQRMDEVIGSVVLEQPWNRPHGTGEICVIDNRTVLRASYHRDRNRNRRGYPIGARYLL